MKCGVDPFDGPVTISLGAAQMNPHESQEELLAEVDGALMRAQAHGRNCVVG
jgi:PleD family two-component response regulator